MPNIDVNGKMSIVNFGTTIFYFSYNTLIAFEAHGKLRIRENIWGPTTGKHLNLIDRDKSRRINAFEFKAYYETTFSW